MFKIIRTTSDNIDFQELIEILDDDLTMRYGIAQAQNDVYNKIESLDTVVIGYLESNPIACGCFKSYNNTTTEIKRMFVKSENRGSGIAAMVLQELENWAIEKKFSEVVLETGSEQPEAIKFYTKRGYFKIDNYGQYIGNLNSVCMYKKLIR